MSSSNEQSPYASPHTEASAAVPVDGQGDSTGGVIPYKNPPALAAYYLGLFSLFPLLGLFLAIPAFIFGIMGLRKRRQNPAVKGSIHAWIGIVMGGLFTVIWGGSAIMIALSVIYEW